MYTKNQQFLLLLESLRFSKNTIQKFYFNYKFNEDFFKLFEINDDIFPFNKKEINQIKTAILNKNHEKFIQKLNKMKIFCVFYNDDYYPKNYINIDSPPIVLYTIGDVGLFNNHPLLSVIGTRKPTKYGKLVVDCFVKNLVDASIVTVSDLAYGIDGFVASSTLEQKGKHIALLAGGLNSIYPSSHTNLARQIIKSGGLLVTEHQPGVKPEISHFINRNRLLAGLSDGLLLIEAGEKSATINTVNHAINFGKELFVIPGNINSDMSKGTNNLISEIPDSFTISPNDIINRFGYEVVKSNKNVVETKMELSHDESIIIDVLFEGELSFDELQEKTKLNVKTLATLLTTLEINGLIKKLPGNYYEKI